MKYAFILTFLLVGYNSTAQKVFVAIKPLFITSEDAFGGGGTVSVGYHQDIFSVGGGVGIITFGEDPYIPIFFETSYLGKNIHKLSPYANLQLGYAKYDGNGAFAGMEDYYIPEPIHINLSAGLRYRVRKTMFLVYGGMSPFSFKQMTGTDLKWKTLFTFGVGVFLKD